MPRQARAMQLECPRDRKPLEEREHEIPGFNVLADHCPECEGIFLDKNELARLTGHKNVNDQITKFLGVDSGSSLVCPACGGLMDDETFVGTDRQIVLDVCLTCKGVWLDADELDQIRALDDSDHASLTAQKRAELFDQDRDAGRRMAKMNPLLRSLHDLARTFQRVRRLR